MTKKESHLLVCTLIKNRNMWPIKKQNWYSLPSGNEYQFFAQPDSGTVVPEKITALV